MKHIYSFNNICILKVKKIAEVRVHCSVAGRNVR